MSNSSHRPKVVSRATGDTRSVTISRQDLNWAAEQGLLEADQINNLWAGLASRFADRPKFTLVNIATYGGAILVLIAMGAIMALFAQDPQSLFGISLAYMAAFAGVGFYLSRDNRQLVPGGLLTTLAVSMTPIVGLS